MHRQTNVMKSILFLFLLWLAAATVCMASPSVSKIADLTVDTQALTINNYGWAINGLPYQQEPVITFNGWQYVAYYHGRSGASGIDGYVCVARRSLESGNGFQIGTGNTVIQSMFSLSWGSGAGDWEILELSDYPFTSNDAHNMISMGICPNDGTIHLSFDHHNQTLNYRVSQAGAATSPESITWDASLFGPVRDYLVSGNTISDVTYPRFWQTPGGDLQFGWRTGLSGNGDWWMADYSGTTHAWSDVHQVIDSVGDYDDGTSSGSDRNPYLNAPNGYGPDGRLHISWTWREGSGTANHDILYAYSEDGGDTWRNNSGVEIGNASTLITLDSPGVTVVPLSSYYGMMNQQGQAVDSQGNVHVLMWHCTQDTYDSDPSYVYSRFGPVGARRYYHYWRNASTGVWTRHELEFDTGNVSSYVGTRPRIFVRSNGDAYAVYQSWQTISVYSTEIYIRYGDLVIQAATAASGWSDWQIIHVEPGSFVGEAIADPVRFADGILSIMMQDSPTSLYAWTPLRILEYQMN